MKDQELLKNALIEYLENQENRDEIYLASTRGIFTINQIKDEVVNETEVGIDMANKIIYLTIDLLTRGKEKI